MKTAEKILLTSLTLFNQHGEANVACVDIALELDISPGNLYYHFKGKEIIVSALFDMYKQRSARILVSPNAESMNLISFFDYLRQLFESAQIFRFIYRNPSDLVDKYPLISRGMKQLNSSKYKAFETVLLLFAKQGILRATPETIHALADMINLIFSQAQNYGELTGEAIDDSEYIEHMLLWVYHLLCPYITDKSKTNLKTDILALAS